MENKKQPGNRIYVYVTAAAILLAAILVVLFATGRSADRTEMERTVTSKTEKEKRDKVLISIGTETIREGLANMGVLMTQEYYFTQVETYTKEKNIFLIIPSSSGFTYSYDGAVMAGVDLTKVSVKTDEDRQVITVGMPPSEIQAVTIDKETFRIYSEKDSIWNPLKLEDYNISLVEFEEAAKEKALAGGILERSDLQAKSLVRGFIESLPNASEYRVEFQ